MQTLQAAQTTPAPQATPGTAPNNGKPGNGQPGMGMPGMHGRGGPGGPGGFGDFGRGIKGGAVTADQANQVISNTTTFVNLAKGDLAYANGKMDTANVQTWLNNADALLQDARSAVNASKYQTAAGYASAAREVAQIAEGQMAQTLGADKLPSYSQRPQGRMGRGMGGPQGANNANITQAQASRVLYATYNNLVAQKATLKSSQALSYLTQAQDAYKTAYSAYQAGKYSDAASSAKIAEQLAGVAHTVEQASTATNDPNAPVTVPAPNF